MGARVRNKKRFTPPPDLNLSQGLFSVNGMSFAPYFKNYDLESISVQKFLANAGRGFPLLLSEPSKVVRVTLQLHLTGLSYEMWSYNLRKTEVQTNREAYSPRVS